MTFANAWALNVKAKSVYLQTKYCVSWSVDQAVTCDLMTKIKTGNEIPTVNQEFQSVCLSICLSVSVCLSVSLSLSSREAFHDLVLRSRVKPRKYHVLARSVSKVNISYQQTMWSRSKGFTLGVKVSNEGEWIAEKERERESNILFAKMYNIHRKWDTQTEGRTKADRERIGFSEQRTVKRERGWLTDLRGRVTWLKLAVLRKQAKNVTIISTTSSLTVPTLRWPWSLEVTSVLTQAGTNVQNVMCYMLLPR